jgi:hypothetical protein
MRARGAGVAAWNQQLAVDRQRNVERWRGRKTQARSETDSVGTVALGQAQFGAQCCFFQLFKLCSNFKIQDEDNPDVQKY